MTLCAQLLLLWQIMQVNVDRVILMGESDHQLPNTCHLVCSSSRSIATPRDAVLLRSPQQPGLCAAAGVELLPLTLPTETCLLRMPGELICMQSVHM